MTKAIDDTSAGYPASAARAAILFAFAPLGAPTRAALADLSVGAAKAAIASLRPSAALFARRPRLLPNPGRCHG